MAKAQSHKQRERRATANQGLRVAEILQALDVESFPNAHFEGARLEREMPAESEALAHPQLVALAQAAPVPAHLRQPSNNFHTNM